MNNTIMKLTKEKGTTDAKQDGNEDSSQFTLQEAQFVLKDIVKKRKDPQQKMETYFPVTKSKAVKVEKNFQGFPLTECRYEEEVGKMVYCPPRYGVEQEEDEGTKDNKNKEEDLCHHCLLRPCIVKAKWNDIMGFCEDTIIFENDDTNTMYFKVLNFVETIILVDVFGGRFARNNPVPCCVNEMVSNYFVVQSGMDDEVVVDPDEELVERSVDGKDFLTQTWNYK